MGLLPSNFSVSWLKEGAQHTSQPVYDLDLEEYRSHESQVVGFGHSTIFPFLDFQHK